jgi:hypothetical protein
MAIAQLKGYRIQSIKPIHPSNQHSGRRQGATHPICGFFSIFSLSKHLVSCLAPVFEQATTRVNRSDADNVILMRARVVFLFRHLYQPPLREGHRHVLPHHGTSVPPLRPCSIHSVTYSSIVPAIFFGLSVENHDFDGNLELCKTPC